MNAEIKTGSLIEYTIHQKIYFALVLDFDDDGINAPLYKVLIEDKISWEYLRNKELKVISEGT
jgi:hypothetical protein